MNSLYEKLISIADSSDSLSGEGSPISHEKLLHSGPQFEAEITRLKADSTLKFRRKWEEIISKYSAVDDAESDEIDLHTGKITIDNGHLRSLPSEDIEIDGIKVNGDIWSGSYDFEKIERDQKRTQKNQRTLKHKLKEELKEKEAFHNSSFTTASESEILEDNLLLISSSPKKPRLSPSKKEYLSPLKSRSLHYISPNSGKSSSSPLSALDTSSSPFKRGLFYMDDSTSPSKPPTNIFSLSPLKRSSTPQLIYATETEDLSGDDSYSNNSTDDIPIVSDLIESKSVALYSCAFSRCLFYSAIRNEYKKHLTSSHSGELEHIGYPVSAKQHSDFTIPELTVLKLALHFPLHVELPEEPYRCSKSCNCVFTSADTAKEHREQAPKYCSKRRQVLLCPILGCNFMTDDGYYELRGHVSNHKRKSVTRAVRTGDLEDISDLFSDTVSSVESGDDEKGVKEANLSSLQSSVTPSTQPISSYSTIEHFTRTQGRQVSVSNRIPMIPPFQISHNIKGRVAENLSSALDNEDEGYSSIEELFKD